MDDFIILLKTKSDCIKIKKEIEIFLLPTDYLELLVRKKLKKM